MTTLENLKAEIRKVGLSNATRFNAKEAKGVLGLFESVASEEKNSDSGPTPLPLEPLIYVIKGILYPNIIHDQISDLLRLLTMVEFWRLRAVSLVSNALQYQLYFRSMQDENTVLLDAATEEAFKGFSQDSETFRYSFLEIVSYCVERHIKWLWIVGSNTEFWSQFNEYFGTLMSRQLVQDIDTSKLSHIFYSKMSVKELDYFVKLKGECQRFFVDALQVADDQREDGQSVDEIFKSEAFRKDYIAPPLDVSLGRLQLSLDIYLEDVVHLVRAVHKVFPDKLPLP